MKWTGLALLGIAIAAAVAIAAGSLASRQIGLASEPLDAGNALAPRSARRLPSTSEPKSEPAPQPQPEPERRPETSPIEPTSSEPAPPTGSDDGHSRDFGGRGADD